MQSGRATILAVSLAILVSASALQAEMTNQQEALTIAENHINLIVTKDGDWGGVASATVASIQELKRGERTLGYFCPVDPKGYIVLSLHKELAPVKVFSVDSNLNPDSDVGMTDVIKVFMERILDAVEEDIGGPIDPDDTFDDVLETNYRSAWNALVQKDFDPSRYNPPRRSRSAGMNYQEGDVLLSTAWSQGAPWNDTCPYPGYWDPNQGWVTYECDSTSNGRTWVGCVATAAAQIMNHWEWPPYGAQSPYNDSYDWNNMCDEYWWSVPLNCWVDENWNPVTQAQLDAVTELSREIGEAVDMGYGCSGSSAHHEDMEVAFEDNFRYSSSCNVKYRCCDFWGDPYYTAFEWYELMMNQLNINRPLQYGIPGHSLNVDGWKMEQIGDEYYWYHMNYGWAGTTQPDPEWQGHPSSNAWFALDAHPGGSTSEDELIRTIVPNCAIGDWMSGSYGVPSPINARYFDQDTEGENATFAAGIWFQALKPGGVIRGNGTGGDAITFNGAPGDESRFYFSADYDTYTRIRITDGAIKLSNGGEMVIH